MANPETHAHEISKTPTLERLRAAVVRARTTDGSIKLREEQAGVLDDALDYIESFAEETSERFKGAFARIVLPPRTGKTVVAAKLIERLRLNAVFVTTTRVLVEQARKEFLDKLPGVPVGVLTGEEKDLPERGIAVMTYQMLHVLEAQRTIPPILKHADLIFADEAHHAITAKRSGLLRGIFDPHAIRIALTATPDYDELRTLASVFPDLIHEMTIEEGIAMGLLAKAHAYLAPIDVGTADVRIIGGEYDQAAIGDLLSRAPILQAAEIVRYDPDFRDVPTLVACVTRSQAHAVRDWLADHRPEGAPEPALVLGNTEREERERILAAFDAGSIDTIVNVGVLIEGWNAPRCKLLVDLSPSLSWVRSAQKFARVLTKDGDAEAHIVVLTPHDLVRKPVLPMEVFGPGVEASWDMLAEQRTETRITRKTRQRVNPLQRMREQGIRVQMSGVSVEWTKAYSIDARHAPSIGRAGIRALLRASGFSTPFNFSFRGYSLFINARFPLNGTVIRGSHLLGLLGLQVSLRGYQRFLMAYFPDDVADVILTGNNASDYYARKWGVVPRKLECGEKTLPVSEMEESCAERFRREFYREDHAIPLKRKDGCKSDDGWIAATGGDSDVPADVLLCEREDLKWLQWILQPQLGRESPLTSMEHHCICKYYGFQAPERDWTLQSIGNCYGLSGERIRVIIHNGIAKLRKCFD